ncbi:KTSC domain-containing protein [Terrimonas sp. NA20]|uniref:KTSC domain-containing protein n=1 Tax=Terrimonas ginsenosidimutans TaxID=2908004 RepID=A0ABS9KX20_9BACT|nr:KTSC domain-containing protein [Terrimonas ginsenosidimutans]MCG2616887.1 KTSC domain-containing protein [Terrimonas ginsenosidimutans]
MPSTVIAAIKYNEPKEILRIVFVSGSVYDYLKVPADLYRAMISAKSKGTFLNNKIKGFYSFRKMR